MPGFKLIKVTDFIPGFLNLGSTVADILSKNTKKYEICNCRGQVCNHLLPNKTQRKGEKIKSTLRSNGRMYTFKTEYLEKICIVQVSDQEPARLRVGQ